MSSEYAIPRTYRRKMSSEITPRKFVFPRKSLGNFRRNSEENKFRGNSEDNKFVGRFLGIYRGTPSSEYFDGIPMVQSSEVSTKYSSECSSGISEERGPRKIPRNFFPSEISEELAGSSLRWLSHFNSSNDECKETHH
ncbi:hypothetical protein F2Q68_00039588 [Brassica cretica]|uniref:Uncharacterized protein n=1 Tax=Brassica cretica TaxID=69181 RepID=A0A8S9MGF2_BRACR|nr:hypothetical protein F2Q68_00039588 [Brassica cretica]